MTTKRLLLIAVIVLALLPFTAPTFAQRVGDRDGDGVPDSVDSCPAEPGPRTNGGCPLPDKSPNPNAGGDTPDRDGDGVPDYVDACADQPGTGFTDGCPDNIVPDTAPAGQTSNPPLMTFTWGSMVQCMVGLLPTAPTTVNIREQPTTSAAIIGQLMPGQQFAPFFRDYDANGNVWFGGAPAGDGWGWVAGSVVADNGQCDGLPMVIPVDAPYQPQIELLPDVDVQSYGDAGEQVYLAIKLENVQITSYQLGVLDNDAPGGSNQGFGHWEINFTLFHEDGTPLSDDPGLQPFLLVKTLDRNSPAEEDCAAIGEGFCLLAGLLLPAFGDQPGQCPPQTFIDGLQAAFPGGAVGGDFDGDGDTDGRDFLIWQRNYGTDPSELSLLLPASDPAAGEFYNGWITIESISSSNGFGLLLPAIQAAREAAAHSGEPKPGMELSLAGDGSVLPVEQISSVYEKIDWNYNPSCVMMGFAPGGQSAAMGDGSVRPVYQWSALLLPYIEQS